MSSSQLIQVILVGLGALTIGAAIQRTNAVMKLESHRLPASGWRTLRVMMAGFLIGYCAVIWLILAGTSDILGWLVGGIFLGGAAFVYAVVEMSVKSLEQLVASSHSSKAYQITLDTVVDAILTIDANGTILFANTGATQTFGYEGEEMIGQNVVMLMPSPYAEEHDGYMRRYLETGEAQVIGVGREVVGRRKDGSTFPADLAINEMMVGGERRFVGSLRDISERKEVDRMKGEFISVVSHELRTPLTSIRGSLGLLLGGVGGEFSEKGTSLLNIGVRSCDRLIRLINDILDVEKIESGALEMKRSVVATGDLLSTAVDASRGFASEQNVEIEASEPSPDVYVNVDEDRILQVFTNLISNAIKFSPEHGVVRVTCREVGGHFRVEVHDDGPGIPEEFQSHLFSRFAQADASSTRKVAGSGLGLNISKAIVDQHGGDIGFETSADAGTTFFVELDLARQKAAAPREEPGVDARDLPRVLACEDDADLADVIAETLRGEGCICDVVHDAAGVKQALGERQYEVLFLDLFLPGQDGISLIRELREEEATRELPIVVVSAVAAEGRSQLRGQMFPVVDWIDKPFEEERLRLALSKSLFRTDGARGRVLHVEDDFDVGAIVRGYLANDAEVVHVPTLKEARASLSDSDFDLVLVDLELPDGSGLELIAELDARPDAPGVLVFSGSNIPDEVRAQVEGVLRKDTTSGEQLRRTARQILARCGKRRP